MSVPPRFRSAIEPLEARIAPAVVLTNLIPDVVAGIGKTGASIDLGQLTAPTATDAYHSKVQFITNYDTDPNVAGIQAGIIELELFDDLAPLTVQNFLAYLNNPNAKGDYDGTLFHRAINGFILQGGGFEAATPKVHIPTFPGVHNEADIVNRSNLAGTVAMAKLPGDPNGASSEWFINLGDNSANLDFQNGGFTVFGKVTPESLALAQAITSLPKINVGAGSDTPAQNGRPISLVDAVLLPATASPATGLTYTVESIVVAGTATPSDLLTAGVNGQTLVLAFGAGKSGVAEVTVQISDGTMTETDTFTVDVRPNVVTHLIRDTMPQFLLPGDSGAVTFSIANAGAVTGSGAVNIYLSAVTVVKNQFGQITDFTAVSPASTLNLIPAGSLTYILASGASQTGTVPVKLPSTLFGADETIYRVFTEIVPAGDERFNDDNRSTETSLHAAVNKFGSLFDINFGSRTNAVLKYNVESSTGEPGVATWTMKGPGTGTVGADASGDDVSVTTRGTTLASTVTAAFSKAGGHIGLEGINFIAPIGTANLTSVDVSGLIAISAGIKTLKLGDLSGESLMLIGPVLPDNSVKAAITLRNVTDFSLESGMPLASLTVSSWKDTPGSPKDKISALALGVLKVAGDFEADLSLTDGLPTSSIIIGGKLQNSTITTTANIGTVSVGAMLNSNILVGVSDRPTSAGDFLDPLVIQSFTIRGIKNFTGSLFSDSLVAAQTLGSIKVQRVATTSGNGDFGFVADVIRSYSRIGGPARANVLQPETFDDLGDYVVTVV